MRTLLGIDPGRSKCGFAVVGDDGGRMALEVVPTSAIEDRIARAVDAGTVAAFCVGDATTSERIVRLCRTRWPHIPCALVDESHTTLQARRLYFEDHPPRGLARFIPRGLLVPPEPLDGYAALLIVQRYRQGNIPKPIE